MKAHGPVLYSHGEAQCVGRKRGEEGRSTRSPWGEKSISQSMFAGLLEVVLLASPWLSLVPLSFPSPYLRTTFPVHIELAVLRGLWCQDGSRTLDSGQGSEFEHGTPVLCGALPVAWLLCKTISVLAAILRLIQGLLV